MRIVPLILACLALGALTPVHAQSPATPAPSPSPASAEVDQADDALQALMAASRSHALSDADLKAKQAAIPPIQAKLTDALNTLTPHLQDVEARLAQLGPAPAAGQPAEDPEIAASRRNLNRIHVAVDSDINQAHLLSVEAGQLNATLTNRLSANFSARLWAHGRSIIDPLLWRDFAAALPEDFARLTGILGDEARQFSASARQGFKDRKSVV